MRSNLSETIADRPKGRAVWRDGNSGGALIPRFHGGCEIFFEPFSAVKRLNHRLIQMNFMTNKILTLALASTFSLAALSVTGADKVDISKLPPALEKKGVTYDKDIKPLFEKNCFKCHGEEKQKGKLRLDSLAATLKGGEEGEILKKGDSAASPIVIAVARLDEDLEMPPAKKDGSPVALSKEEVGLIRAWIDQGAR